MDYCTPDEIIRNAVCLLGRVEEVRCVLRRRGFSEHAIDQAITAVYRAGMDYITGRKPCSIKNRRAWVFKVAKRAARRATSREVFCCAIEPAMLAATVEGHAEGDDKPFDICEALSRLTELQSEAIQRCILNGESSREAARRMGIAVSTLCNHLRAGKERLRAILADHEPQCRSAELYEWRERA